MKSNLKYGLSKGIRLFVCSMAVFFSFLAIVDSFQKRAEIIYAGEFVSEADFKFIELPNILQSSSSHKISKAEKIEVIQPVNWIFNSISKTQKIEIISVAETVHLFLPTAQIFKYSLNTNAP
jgi:hypothetical protein